VRVVAQIGTRRSAGSSRVYAGTELAIAGTMNLRLGLAVLAVMAAGVHTMGCADSGGVTGCGVGPAAGPNNQNGTVTFDALALGSSEDLVVPLQDSNPAASETLMGASFTGPDAAAFEVISTFPIPIAAGAQVNVQIRFSPTHEGSSSATLVLDTEDMGLSPVELQGTATATGG
jgi:hypothetical protein